MPLIAFGPRKDTPRPGMPIALMSAFAKAQSNMTPEQCAKALHTLDGTTCIKLRKDTGPSNALS